VDHFIPRSLRPDLAYEWSNFRFASRDVNARKGAAVNVVDPFEVETGWFALAFPSLLVTEGPIASTVGRARLIHTIDALGLNDERLIDDRAHWLRQFCREGTPLTFLERHAPFIAAELVRQGIVETIAAIMRFN
jgi:hypothetical protein